MKCFSKWCIQSLWIALNYSSETLPCFPWTDSSYSKTPLRLYSRSLWPTLYCNSKKEKKKVAFWFYYACWWKWLISIWAFVKAFDCQRVPHTIWIKSSIWSFPILILRVCQRNMCAVSAIIWYLHFIHLPIRRPKNSQTLSWRSHIINYQTAAVTFSEVYLLSQSRLSTPTV